jgi:hypothetical protein
MPHCMAYEPYRRARLFGEVFRRRGAAMVGGLDKNSHLAITGIDEDCVLHHGVRSKSR